MERMTTKHLPRVQHQAVHSDLDPYESLVAAVIRDALKAEGASYLNTRGATFWLEITGLNRNVVAGLWLDCEPKQVNKVGRFWLDLMGLNASAVRREAQRLST